MTYASVLEKSENLSAIKQELFSYEKDIKELDLEFKKIEEQLVPNSKKYLQVIEKRREIEKKTTEISILLKNVEDKQNVLYQENQKILKAALLNSFDKEIDSVSILNQKLFLNLQKKKLEELKNSLLFIKEKRVELEDLKKRFTEYVELEENLKLILEELDAKKLEVVQSLTDVKGKKEDVSRKYDKAKKLLLSTNLNKKSKINYRGKIIQDNSDTPSISMRFLNPVTDYYDIEHGPKGVTYHIDSNSDIYAPQSGEVAYVGELSTFGKVVMLDHGNETRSVLLGDLTAFVKKGDVVKLGDKMAMINGKDKKSKLYFDVRIKKVVLNTMKLIDQNLAIKTNKDSVKI